MTQRILFRRDTDANWQASSVVPLDGEVILSTDTKKIQIGWNNQNLNQLPQVSFYSTSGSVPVQLKPLREIKHNSMPSLENNKVVFKTHPTRYFFNIANINEYYSQQKDVGFFINNKKIVVEGYDDSSNNSTITFGKNYYIEGCLYIANLEDFVFSEIVSTNDPHKIDNKSLMQTFSPYKYTLFCDGIIASVPLQKKYEFQYYETIYDQNGSVVGDIQKTFVANFDKKDEMKMYVLNSNTTPYGFSDIIDKLKYQVVGDENNSLPTSQKQYLSYLRDNKYIEEADNYMPFYFTVNQNGFFYKCKMTLSNLSGVPYDFDNSLIDNSDFPQYETSAQSCKQYTTYSDMLKDYIAAQTVAYNDGENLIIEKPFILNYRNNPNLQILKQTKTTSQSVNISMFNDSFTFSKEIKQGVQAINDKVISSIQIQCFATNDPNVDAKKRNTILFSNPSIDSNFLNNKEDSTFLKEFITGVTAEFKGPLKIKQLNIH